MKSCSDSITTTTTGLKLDRKTVEKNRRMHMKSLCMKLSSLIPKDQFNFNAAAATSKDLLTQQDHLEQATSYIINLQQRIEKLKERKGLTATTSKGIEGINKGINTGMKLGGFKLPVVEIRHQDLSMEVVLISGLNKRFKFHEVISVLEEEGAEVVNASFSVVGDKIFHTIHSQAICSKIGLEASKISERLKDLVH